MLNYVILLCVLAVAIGTTVAILKVIYEWLEGLWTRFVTERREKKAWKHGE